MMNMERRHGSDKPVIKKALVELEGASPSSASRPKRVAWAGSSDYRLPGGIQYFGPSELTDKPTATLHLERGAVQ
jgi:pyrophosphate--fructose-6-phosphate 1-phosphotransferase